MSASDSQVISSLIGETVATDVTQADPHKFDRTVQAMQDRLDVCGEGSNHDITKLSEEEKRHYEEYEHYIETGKLKPRCAADSRWRRSCVNFAKLKGQDWTAMNATERKRLRDDWFQVKKEELDKKMCQEESYSRSDLADGEFMTFGQLVQSFGGWELKPAVLAAKRVAVKCALLKTPDVYKVDDLSELPMYIRIHHKFEHRWTKKCSTFLQKVDAKQKPLPAAASGPSPPAAAS